MNWNKFLNIMILIFLIFNIGMFSYQKYYEGNRYTLSNERVSQLTTLVNSQGIGLYNVIPSYYPKSQIELESPKVDKEIIAKNILGEGFQSRLEDITLAERLFTEKQSLTFYVGEQDGLVYYKSLEPSYIPKDMTINNIDETALRFAEDLFGDNVTMAVTNRKSVDKTEENGEESYRLELNEVYKENIIFQTYIKLQINKNGIVEALGIRYEPVDYLGAKKNIYPFDEVIYSLMYFLENDLATAAVEDSVLKKTIRDIDIGYYIVDVDQRKISYQVDPHYRIIFEDGEVFYINAYTNDITRS